MKEINDLLAFCKDQNIMHLPVSEAVKIYMENLPEPLFINSLGEKFYEGDQVWYISLPDHYVLRNDEINDLNPLSLGNQDYATEIMTYESAKKWLEDAKLPVSGSFTDVEIKHIIYYGHTKHKRFFLDEEGSALDYWIEDLFRKRGTEWDEVQEMFEKIFWGRIRKLVENCR